MRFRRRGSERDRQQVVPAGPIAVDLGELSPATVVLLGRAVASEVGLHAMLAEGGVVADWEAARAITDNLTELLGVEPQALHLPPLTAAALLVLRDGVERLFLDGWVSGHHPGLHQTLRRLDVALLVVGDDLPGELR